MLSNNPQRFDTGGEMAAMCRPNFEEQIKRTRDDRLVMANLADAVRAYAKRFGDTQSMSVAEMYGRAVLAVDTCEETIANLIEQQAAYEAMQGAAKGKE